MMKKLLKYYSALLLLLFTLSNAVSAQTQEPVDFILINTAPNLAWIQRTDATVNVFKGDKFKYSLVDNNNVLRKWVSNYPQEFVAYKNTFDNFFKTKNVGDFKPTDQDFYYDLKAQYEMLKILNPW